MLLRATLCLFMIARPSSLVTVDYRVGMAPADPMPVDRPPRMQPDETGPEEPHQSMTLAIAAVRVACGATMVALTAAALVALGTTGHASPSDLFSQQQSLVTPSDWFWYLGGAMLLWLLFGLVRLELKGGAACWSIYLLTVGMVLLAVSLLVLGTAKSAWAAAAFSTASWIALIAGQFLLGNLKYQAVHLSSTKDEPEPWDSFKEWLCDWSCRGRPRRLDLGHWASFVCPYTAAPAIVGVFSWIAWLAAYPSRDTVLPTVVAYYVLQVAGGALIELRTGDLEYPAATALVAVAVYTGEIRSGMLRTAVVVGIAVHLAVVVTLLLLRTFCRYRVPVTKRDSEDSRLGTIPVTSRYTMDSYVRPGSSHISGIVVRRNRVHDQ